MAARICRPCGRPVTSRLRGRTSSVRVMAAKSVLITGGNTGIGFETSKALLQKGYTVTMACRDDKKAADAAQRLRALVPGADVHTLHLDLAELSSVRDCASAWLDSGRPLDVLLNNAGIMACPKMLSKDGFEMQFATNHLGHYLLTSLLLPQITASGSPARIINVASLAHLKAKINFDDINYDEGYNPWVAYRQSKLANVLFTYGLSAKLDPSLGITVNTLHPGVVRTELARYLIKDPDALLAKALTVLTMPFTLSPEQGAQTSIYLASSPEVEGVTAKYFDTCKPVPSCADSYDPALATRLLTVSAEMVEKAVPAVAGSLVVP